MKFIKISKLDGFTLIEVLCSISVIILTAAFLLCGLADYNRYIDKIETKTEENSILAFIQNSKEYARFKKDSCYIIYDVSLRKFKLIHGSGAVASLTLPNGFYVQNIVTKDTINKIIIDKTGFTDDACTIRLISKLGHESDITISVGTACTTIK